MTETSDPEAVVRLKIVLEDTDPPVWRTVEVPAATTLKALHGVIQAAMGWDNAHLHEFELGRQRAPASATLADLAARRVKRIGYVYDMGDSWEHTVRIEKVMPAAPGTAYPRLVDGAGRCPPEDCGGLPGFYEFLDAIADPEHPEHEDLLDWYGGPFDPADMDRLRIEKDLARLATRRKPKRRKAGA